MQNAEGLNQGWETYLLSRAAWIAHHRWWAEKFLVFILNRTFIELWGRVTSLNTLASGHFRGFSRKKHQNERGFAQEFLWSYKSYRPG